MKNMIPNIAKVIWKYIQKYEQWFFPLFGVISFILAIRFFMYEKTIDGIAIFSVGFLCFIFSDLSRFENIKAIGIEAKLFKNKRKEADELIGKLKTIIEVYTRELVMARVRHTKKDGHHWKETWNLFEELKIEYEAIDQGVDLSKLRSELESEFLMDIYRNFIGQVQRSLSKASDAAYHVIDARYHTLEPYKEGVSDPKARDSERNLVQSMHFSKDYSVLHKQGETVFELIMKDFREVEKIYIEKFDVKLDVDPEILSFMESMEEYYADRPLRITDKAIEFAKVS